MQMTTRTLSLGLTIATTLAGAVFVLTTAHAQRPAAAPAGANTVPGQTTTLLPDGRWLLLGGERGGRASQTAAILDPSTGATMILASSMIVARAGHTATVLADGTVLIVGGREAAGQLADVPELFDPDAAAFMPITIDGATARTGHTATLLSDGRVLVAGGGTSADRLLRDVEIWDVRAQRAIAAGELSSGRYGQTATLLEDGRVALAGGVDGAGRPVTQAAIVDPTNGRVTELSAPAADDAALPRVAASTPPDAAVDVPIDVRLAMRVSRPLQVTTVTAASVRLVGEEGAVDARVVAAEGGRLVFVTPRAPLRYGSPYTLNVAGATDVTGQPLVEAPVAFVTASAPKDASADSADEESGVPNARSRENGWRSERPPSPWESLPPLMAAPGVTAISGRVLTLDGQPLAGVSLSVEGDAEVHSDRTGRFLVELKAAPTARRVLKIDGAPANKPNRRYGFFEYGATVRSGTTNVLPFTIWEPKLDTLHQVHIPSPTTSEVVVTTPSIPGLELHLPPGTTIIGHDGKPVTTIGITAIPVDRPPFPLAKNVPVPVYFTAQPGSAYVKTSGAGPKGAWLVYPNYHHAPAGKRVQFFHYDPDVRDWYVYGPGTVMPSGTQVTADATTRFYEFTGAMFGDGASPAGKAPPPGANNQKADPVDPSTGLFGLHKTDLYLPDVIPLALTRTYDSGDTLARPMGRGMTHPYAMFLWSFHQYDEVDLLLPEGGKVHFVRTSPGTSWTDAVLVHQETATTSATPTPFYKAVIVWNGNGWNLTLKDGTVYVFGENAPLQAIRDRYGNQVTITHANGQTGDITRVTSPNGRWIAFTYDASDRVSQVADNIGRSVSYTYDANGNLSTVTDPEQHVTTYTYDGSNALATIKDGRNIVYLTNQYTNGLLTRQTLADPNAVYQFAYTVDGSGAITQTDITNPRGYVERLTFNSTHYEVSDIEAVGTPLQRTRTTERAAGSNLVTAVVDGLSRRTEYTYDASGHVLTTTTLAGTPDAATTTFTYEPTFFQLATITDPLQHTWTMGYDGHGNLASASDPLSHQTTVAMDTAGHVTSTTDPLQHVWHVAYSGADQTSMTNPLGAVWRTFTDAAGRKLSATDPLGRVTAFVPDRLNRVTSVTDPLGGQTTFSYDPNSNLSSLSDALTHATAYTYDTSDRVATRTDPLQHAASYGYDLNGNASQVTDRKGQATLYQYDALDRLAVVTYADLSTVTYTYDAGNRLHQITDSANGTITRTYDGQDRLTEETTPQGTVDYTYDADGRRATMTVAGQPAVAYGYDNAHRLTSITQGTSLVAITYDNANRRSTLTYPNGIVATYGYDDANELTSLAYSLGPTTLGDLTYTYDLAGQRTAIGGSWARTGLPEPVASATYDVANRIATWNGQPFSYDLNGNLASSGVTSYSWNARNQLAELSGVTSASFAYDGASRRRAKTISGTTTNFLFDELNLIQELSGSTPTANLLTGLTFDETFTRTDATGTSAFLTDTLGSTLELADASGTLQTHYTYEPFGTTTTSGATSTNAAQFTGRENDGIGLYFNRARFYSGSLQRWISEDPIEFAAGDVNLYAYVGNQATMWRDPSGLVKFPLPPGHPCRWPPDGGGSKSKSDAQAPKEPPLSWWLMCSPTVVPDTVVPPDIRPGADGWPRVRLGYHDTPHPFPWLGPQPHIQLNIWWDGVPDSGIVIRIPFPRLW
jgi:RHS repeat-associated protein